MVFEVNKHRPPIKAAYNNIHRLLYARQNILSFLCIKLLFIFTYQALAYCTPTWCMSSDKTFRMSGKRLIKKLHLCLSLSCSFFDVFSVSYRNCAESRWIWRWQLLFHSSRQSTRSNTSEGKIISRHGFTDTGRGRQRSICWLWEWRRTGNQRNSNRRWHRLADYTVCALW